MKLIHKIMLHFVQILLALIIIGLSYLSYDFVNRKSLDAMERLKVDVISQVEEQWGIKIRYKGIAPSFLNNITISDLSIYADGSHSEIISMEEVRIKHDIFGYFLFNKTIIDSIRIQGLELSYNKSRDSEALSRILENINTADSEKSMDSFDLGTLFAGTIKIKDWAISYESPDRSLQGRGRNLNLEQLDEYLRVRGAGDFSYKDYTENPLLEYANVSLGIQGTLQTDLQAFSLDSEFQNVDTSMAFLENQRLNISFQNDVYRLTKIKDKQPYDLSIVLTDQTLILDLAAEQFNPSSLLYFHSDLEQINPWLESTLSGKVQLSYGLDTGFLQYDVDGEIQSEYDSEDIHLAVDIHGDDLFLKSETLALTTSYGRIDWKGEWVFNQGFPEGSLALSNVKLGPDQVLKGFLDLRNIDDYYSIESRKLSLKDGSNPGNMKALIYQSDDSYIFSLLSELDSENRRRDRVLLDGEFSFLQGLKLQSSFRIQSMELAALAPYLSQEPIDALLETYPGIMFQSEGVLSLANDELMVQLNRFNAAVPGEDKKISISGFYGNDALDVYSLEMLWDENYILASGRSEIHNGKIQLESRWNLNDNKYSINGLIQKDSISLLGSHGLQVQLSQKNKDEYLGYLKLQEMPILWGGESLTATVDIRGRSSSNNWEILLNDSSVKWLNSELLYEPELKMTAFVAPGMINVLSLGYKDVVSELNGNGTLYYDLDNEIYNGSLSLKDSHGSHSEAIDLVAAYNDQSLSVSLQVQNTLMDRFKKLDMLGRLSTDLTVEGRLDAPVLDGFVSAPDLLWNKNPFALQGRIRMGTEKLEIYELEVNRNSLYLHRGLGVYDFKDGKLVFTAALANNENPENITEGSSIIESGISLRVDTGLTFNFKNPEVPVLDNFDGRLRIHPVKWNGLTTFASKTIEFSRKDAVVEALLLNDPEQFFYYNENTHQIKARLKEDFPVALNLEGHIKADDLDLHLNDLTLNLNLINYIMPKDRALRNRYVVFREGSLMKGSAHIGGTLKEPDFNGKLSSHNLKVLTPYTESNIEEAFVEATIVNDLLTTNDVFIPIGNGGIKAQGYLTMRGWGLNEYSLDIEAVGSPGTPVNYNAYGLNGTGALTGKFRFHGDTNQGNFEGRVVVDELVGSIGDRTELIPKIKKEKDGPGYSFKLNLDIVTGKNVMFILPNPQVELVRAIAEQGETLNISVDTLNKTLSMTGGITIRSGEIYYFDRTFLMTDGALTFNEDQDTFNPFLNIEAEIDTTDANGDNVTIYLMYRNPVLDEFVPIMRSNPSMAEDQIIALFGQSLIPYDETGEADISRLLIASGGMVSQYGFVRPLEQALKDSLNLDNVTIKTEILENAILDQLNRESSVVDAGSTSSMAKYLDNTSLYLGKFAGDFLYFSAGMVVDYDQLYGLRSYLNGVSIVPDLTIEMRTPFFLVFWNYNKRNAFDFHNTDFMKNNAIGLEWRYSF